MPPTPALSHDAPAAGGVPGAPAAPAAGPFPLAERLERHLGDPAGTAGPFTYADAVRLDEESLFPAAICADLDEFGLARHYVPAEHGGDLARYDEALQMTRAVARRDLTVAIGHGKTYLGAVSVWVSGDAAQAAALGATIISGVPVSWGLTERDHGSDLLAGEMTATATEDGYRVTGEKWLINNATRGQVLCALVRTRPEGGARGFSLLLIDKSTLPEGTVTCLPKVATLGIRGADISGLRLAGAPVPSGALVGREGGGIETVLKGLQLTRTLCAALSLGAADHALRLAAGFADDRHLYGRRLADLPYAAHTLGELLADHLLGEALALVAARSIHTLTGEMTALSACVKYLVPTLTETLVARARKLLGARSLLLDLGVGGRFEKLERDNRIVSLFDGNTVVNLHALINQFPGLARAWRDGPQAPLEAPPEGLRVACDLSAPLPRFEPGRLSLVTRRGLSVLRALPHAAHELDTLARATPALRPVADLAARFTAAADVVHAAMARQEQSRMDVPPGAYELAGRFTLCVAGAAAVALWLGNRETWTEGLWRDGAWLHAALTRAMDGLGEPVPGDEPPFPELAGWLLEQARTGRPVSLVPGEAVPS